MTMLIADRHWVERIQAQRKASGADGRDEVWDGVTFMPPLPNDEHQAIAMMLGGIFLDVIGWPGLGHVRAGINLSDRAEGWMHNYREPDVAVILNGSAAINHGTHWQGAVDFLVEIVSPDDRSRDKLPFYGDIGVREVLILDRDPWALELYRLEGGQLRLVGRSTAERPDVLSSGVLPLTFQLTPGGARPWLRVTHVPDGRPWTV
jgi:Uma2 family endonuclease